jgi:hypothetical protein
MGGRSKEKRDETIRQQQLELISVKTTTTTQKTWDLLSLSLLKACNPYYEHSGARQHEPQQNPLDVGPPEPIYILVFALHTIRV